MNNATPLRIAARRRQHHADQGLGARRAAGRPGAGSSCSNIAALPFVGPWLAVMPDVHLGKGATVGSVVPTRGAIIPAAVGVDIGCGMAAVRTTLTRQGPARQPGPAAFESSSAACRSAMAGAASIGKLPGQHRMRGWSQSGLAQRLELIKAKHREDPHRQGRSRRSARSAAATTSSRSASTKPTRVWVMLHSGSRGTGNLIGSYFIERARQELATRVLGFHAAGQGPRVLHAGRAVVR